MWSEALGLYTACSPVMSVPGLRLVDAKDLHDVTMIGSFTALLSTLSSRMLLGVARR